MSNSGGLACGVLGSAALKESGNGGSIEMSDLYNRLIRLIDGAVLPDSAASSSRKLSRLTIGQLGELLNDLVDEIERRTSHQSVAFLEINLQYSAKRNQARQKLAELTQSRLLQLVNGVKVEIESRFPSLKCSVAKAEESELEKKFNSLSQSINSLLKDTQQSEDESESHCKVMASSMATPCTPMSLTDAFMPVKMESCEEVAAAKLVSTAASASAPVVSLPESDNKKKLPEEHLVGLDSLIEELNMIVGIEHQNEVEKMKREYEGRNKDLLEKLNHFEEEVVPGKNHEIAALTAKLDEVEGRLNSSRREHSDCKGKIEERDRKIEEQARLIAALQESHEELQRRLRSITAANMADKVSSAAAAAAAERPESTINYLMERAGLFTSQWNNFVNVHQKAIEAFMAEDVSLVEKLTCLSGISMVMQKLIKNVEALTAKVNISKMEWIQSDVECLLHHRTKCLQHLSFCLVCCKDMKSGGISPKVATSNVINVLNILSVDCRQLIDSAELIISRGQIPCSPSLLSSQSALDLSLPPHSTSNNSTHSPTRPSSESGASVGQLLRNGTDRIISVCRSLIVLVEDFRPNLSTPQDIIEFSPQLRQGVADSLTRLFEIIQRSSTHFNNQPSEYQIKDHIEMIGEAAKKLQHCIANGSGVFADEKSRSEVKNSCRVLSLTLTELSRHFSQRQ